MKTKIASNKTELPDDIAIRIQQAFIPLVITGKNTQNPPPVTPFLRRLTAILEAHYADETFDVSALCGKLYLCPMQVHRKVKKHTGLAPGKYLLRFRLAKALHLLHNTEYSICKIAEDTGFASPHNFIRAFHREFGCSPGQMRQNAEGEVIKWQKKVALRLNLQKMVSEFCKEIALVHASTNDKSWRSDDEKDHFKRN